MLDTDVETITEGAFAMEISYTLSREYRVVRNRYSRLLSPKWRSPFCQFARARTIDDYDVTMPVTGVRVASQINYSDVTMLNQKKTSLATMAKSAVDNYF